MGRLTVLFLLVGAICASRVDSVWAVAFTAPPSVETEPAAEVFMIGGFGSGGGSTEVLAGSGLASGWANSLSDGEAAVFSGNSYRLASVFDIMNDTLAPNLLGRDHVPTNSFSLPLVFVLSDGISSPNVDVGLFLAEAEGQNTDEFDFAIAIIPEPSTWTMLMLGFVLIVFQIRRQSRIRVEMA